MKRSSVQLLLRAALAVFTLLLWPLSASAHDGDPRVEISADRLQPGLVLEVRGVNIADEEQVTVSLVGVAGQFPLGVAVGNEHGDFVQPFTVPIDLPEGTYKVLVQSSNLPVTSALILIQGPPVLDEEGESELREEEDALLAPIPTVPKAQAPAPTPQPAVIPSSLSPSPTLVFGGLALAVLGLIAIVRRMQSPAQGEKS